VEDRDTVGELTRYRDANVEIRGIVTPMHGRAGILLSHSRQFNGGPPKSPAQSAPCPRLHRRAGSPAHCDPNLRHQGRGRAFMNRLDQEKLPGKVNLQKDLARLTQFHCQTGQNSPRAKIKKGGRGY